MSTATVVSSPGKVLIAGGYLVLDPLYSGTIVSTSSRFYAVVRDNAAVSNRVQVWSPQFIEAKWEYSIQFGTSISVDPAPENESKNKFVQLAIQSTLTLAMEMKGLPHVKTTLSKGIDIAMVGDNDFYSQRAKLASMDLPRTLESLSKIPPFNPTGVRLSEVHKTGLGSSAALITSLVSGLLLHLDVIPTSSFSGANTEGRRLAHNLAQYVHCLAQGKIGSGFDVSAAVFGSHLYTRFNPSVIHGLMNSDSDAQKLAPVLSPSNQAWNYSVEPFKLPPLTRIMLADVDAGSDTPSLVGKVLKWREENSVEAKALWTSLDQLNQSLAQTLLHLSKLHDQDTENYASAVKYISSLQPIQPIVSTFYEAHRISQAVRAKMREMGTLSGVPIEPAEQTKLLDTCVSQAGIVGGGVPGAGGYDAVWVLVCDPEDCSPDQRPRERIEHLWSIYKEMNVSPLSVVESLTGGTQLEKLEDIPGLKNITSPK
ncbi:phosphomevalonate kinase [Infundibulicybe gibba]|nr:phosphomevalonate kinase [Infundibulicybe gibba]